MGNRHCSSRSRREHMVCRAIMWLGIVSAVCLCANSSSSHDRCEFSDVLGDRFVRSENRGGEFRILLSPPEYSSTKAVQKHLVFSSTLARLLTSELRIRTYGQCDASIDTSRFPDLHVYLILNHPSKDTNEDRLRCAQTLESALINSELDDQSIRKGASEEAQFRSQVISNPIGVYSNVSTILRVVLSRIYEPNSALHAIYSVGAEHFQSLDERSFRDWLHRQRSFGRAKLESISLCPPNTDPQDPRVSAPSSDFPYSTMINPGIVTLLLRDGKHVLPQYPRQMVIVGHVSVLNAPDPPPLALVRNKYCNRPHVLEAERAASVDIPAPVRTRCLTSGGERDSWTVFFCDPQDCNSERQTGSVAVEIANDPDVVALARNDVKNGQPRGPYLIKVETTSE